MCGIVGMMSRDGSDVSQYLYHALWCLQHRGKESSGMATQTNDGTPNWHTGMGLVDKVYDHSILQRLKGFVGVGHNRYSTAGSSSIIEAQPFIGSFKDEPFFVSYNGNLINTRELRPELEQKGWKFATKVDTEVITAAVSVSGEKNFLEAVFETLPKLKGAFSIIFLHDQKLYAVRDVFELRPLSLGINAKSVFAASEDCFFDLIGGRLADIVRAGECVIIDRAGRSLFERRQWSAIIEPKFCIFEYIYFSRPDSTHYGRRVKTVQKNLGRRLAEEHPIETDCVIPVPDSGNYHAMGYAQKMNPALESGDGIFRSHYIGRTFIEPVQELRELGVIFKHHIIPEDVKRKRIVVVDDSIVRATTIKKIVERLREAGAKKIHVRIGSPMYQWPCFYGMDTYRIKDELVAKRHNNEKEAIRREIQADSLEYLGLEGAKEAILKTPLITDYRGETDFDFCDACFSGNYFIK